MCCALTRPEWLGYAGGFLVLVGKMGVFSSMYIKSARKSKAWTEYKIALFAMIARERAGAPPSLPPPYSYHAKGRSDSARLGQQDKQLTEVKTRDRTRRSFTVKPLCPDDRFTSTPHGRQVAVLSESRQWIAV